MARRGRKRKLATLMEEMMSESSPKGSLCMEAPMSAHAEDQRGLDSGESSVFSSQSYH